MKTHYKRLLQPIVVGNMMLKNHMNASCSQLYFLQGAEPYPTEQMITHIANKAKNGAAMVTVRGVAPRLGPSRVSQPIGPFAHTPNYDLYDAMAQNYLSQLADAVHDFGSKICMSLGCRIFPGYDVSKGLPARPGQSGPSKELSVEQLYEIADDFAGQALILKRLGFDCVSIHMAYRHTTPGRMLSPLTNHRTDEFGGSIDNRARFPLLCCKKIKEFCGKHFPVQVQISAVENVKDPLAKYDTLGSSIPANSQNTKINGITLEDTIAFAKLANDSGFIDILQLRGGMIDPSHPTGWEKSETPFLEYSAAVKAALPPNASMLIEAVAGFQNPETAEAALAEGKADLIAMARTWISNTGYDQKLIENRIDDIRPCIRCNKCHVNSANNAWVSSCSVNPVIGIEHRLQNIVSLPSCQKKIAVIGGGPGGLNAALYLNERGHKPIIFEKSGQLGGLINHSEFAGFKWPLNQYRNYLIHQIKKHQIPVRFHLEATPDLLKKEKFDAILVAIGGKPIIPQIPGLIETSFHIAADIYGKETSLGQRVVIIGGGEIGVETGIQIAQKGHDALILEAKPELAMDACPLHYRTMLNAAWENQQGLSWETGVTITAVKNKHIFYTTAQKEELSVPYDSLVIAAGYTEQHKEAMKFYGCAEEYYAIGDCYKVGGLSTVNRSAFCTANRI